MSPEEKELERIRKGVPRYVHGIGGTEVTGGRGERPRVHLDYVQEGSAIGWGYADAVSKARANLKLWGYDPDTFERTHIPHWETSVDVVLAAEDHGLRLSQSDEKALDDYLKTQGQIGKDVVDSLVEKAARYRKN